MGDFLEEMRLGEKPFSNDGDSHSVMQNITAYHDKRKNKGPGITTTMNAAQRKNAAAAKKRDDDPRNKTRDAYQGT